MHTLKNVSLTISPVMPNPNARSKQETVWGDEVLEAISSSDSQLNGLYQVWLKGVDSTGDSRCEIALTWDDGFILTHACIKNPNHEQVLSYVLIYAASFQCIGAGLEKMPESSDITMPNIEAAQRLGYSTLVNVLLAAWQSNEEAGDGVSTH